MWKTKPRVIRSIVLAFSISLDNSVFFINSNLYLYKKCFSLLDCSVLLCDFHREQAWERWLSCNDNNMRLHKDAVLQLLRDIASAETEDKYEKMQLALKNSYAWKLPKANKLRNWIDKTWLPCYKVSKLLL